MAKPIFIIELPLESDMESVNNFQEFLKERFSDYNTLVVLKNVSDINYKVFYEKDCGCLNNLKEYFNKT